MGHAGLPRQRRDRASIRSLVGHLALAIALVSVLLLGALPALAATGGQDPARVWRYGWGDNPPFEQRSGSGLSQPVVSGLDAQLLHAVVEEQLRDRLLPEPVPLPISAQLDGIREGRIDVISDMEEGSLEHRRWARFSVPYRRLEMVVAAPTADPGRWLRQRSLAQLITDLQRSDALVGILKDWSYGRELDRVLQERVAAGRCRIFALPDELVDALQRGQVTLGLGERLSLASAIWGSAPPGGAPGVEIAAKPFLIRSSHFIFSRRTVSADQLSRFNRALSAVRRSWRYRRIVRTVLFPVLLEFSAGRWWFYPVELLGVFAAAVAGAVQALRSGFSVVGVVIVAIVTAVGGGLLRDMLINRPVPSVFQSPIYMGLVYLAVVLVVVVGLLAGSLLSRRLLDRWLDGLDAIGIAAFTVTGVLIALRMRAEPLLLWGPLLSVLSSCGGVLVREVILGRGLQALRPGSLYYEISFGCSLLFSLFLVVYSGQSTYRLRDIEAAVLITMVAVALLRLAAIRGGWRSLRLPGRHDPTP